MLGSQASLGNDRSGPELPGMENLGADAVMMGGIEENSEIPAGMEFVPASVPDGNFSFQVAASSKGGQLEIEIKPFCMGFEDYFAAFAPGAHPSLVSAGSVLFCFINSLYLCCMFGVCGLSVLFVAMHFKVSGEMRYSYCTPCASIHDSFISLHSFINANFISRFVSGTLHTI